MALGDPPNRAHPVAWLGRLLAAGRWRLCGGGPTRLLVTGATLTLTVAAIAGVSAAVLATVAGYAGPARPVVIGAGLWLLLSIRGLLIAAAAVAAPLAAGHLGAARAALGWHLVSRPTRELDAAHVASGAVESVAENLTDAFVAPVIFFLLLGLPGAAVYRAVNTADAMLGYRDGPLEYFGKLAARLDDALNLVPARLAAVAIVLAAALGGADAPGAWRTLQRDRGHTASPNAGWTMAAMAGALGLTLEKPGAYRLGDGRPPQAQDIGRAMRLTGVAAALATAVLLAGAALVRTCCRAGT